MPLPSGLTVDPNIALISGTPDAVGSFSFTVVGKDANGFAITGTFTVTITAALPVFTNPPVLPGGEVGAAYSYQLTVSGGTPPYSGFTVTA